MLQPLAGVPNSSSIEISLEAKKQLQLGKVGCVIFAGGQGSRLGLSLPKALVPLLKTGETFLEIALSKIASASKLYGLSLPAALMTSTQNKEPIASFIQERKLGNISLFTQENLPFLDDQGKEVPTRGPCGNGDFFPSFAKSGLLKEWKERGIEQVMILFIDNPLADPFDEKLLTYHLQKRADVTLKCIERIDPKESVGVVALEDGKLCTKEYFELSPEEKEARLPDGSLLFSLANSGMYLFSLPFLEKASTISLPYHLARKEVLVEGKKVPLWKRETFIFDILPYAEKAEALLFDRNEVFAPVKDKKSLLAAQAQLVR